MKSFLIPTLLAVVTGSIMAADEGKSTGSKAPGPAKVSGGLKEADLASVVLTVEAEKRLGIATTAAEKKPMVRYRLFGGEAIAPSPAGTAREGAQSILSILPSLTANDLIRIAEAQIDADAQIEQAKVSFDAAQVALDRAEELLKNKAGSERVVQETRVLQQQAAVALRTAQSRRELLAAPVLDVLNPAVLWIRVPVYVGELSRLEQQAEAKIGALTGGSEATQRSAKPVPAPPSANAVAATADLFYELENADRQLRLGQRLGVQVPLKTATESLVVPASAILYDYQGGAWVYVNSAPQTYVARRVQVASVAGGEAALNAGPPVGAKVVTVGAAELFGTQFGIGK